jgi:hypothetical protein
VAIKKLSRPFQSEIFAKRACRELMLLKHMQHENVGWPLRQRSAGVRGWQGGVQVGGSTGAWLGPQSAQSSWHDRENGNLPVPPIQASCLASLVKWGWGCVPGPALLTSQKGCKGYFWQNKFCEMQMYRELCNLFCV